MLFITVDAKIIEMGHSFSNTHSKNITIYNSNKNPLDIVKFIYESKPSVLLIDDDFINPNSATLIGTLNKVRENLKIIFLTSDSSIELGKEISQLVIQYYAIKPLDEAEFEELLVSILKTNNQ